MDFAGRRSQVAGRRSQVADRGSRIAARGSGRSLPLVRTSRASSAALSGENLRWRSRSSQEAAGKRRGEILSNPNRTKQNKTKTLRAKSISSGCCALLMTVECALVVVRSVFGRLCVLRGALVGRTPLNGPSSGLEWWKPLARSVARGAVSRREKNN